MTQPYRTDLQTSADAPPDVSEGAFSQEKRAAEGLIDDVKIAASNAGSQAKTIAAEKAEALQGAAASQLHLFADAVRTAGDELAEKDPGPVSDLVRQAAAGLEQFSGALGRRSSAEMIDCVREFGRQNPVGFLAGSMLAGFALARFAGSATPQSADGSSDSQGTAGNSGSREPSDEEWSSEDWKADRQEATPSDNFGNARADDDAGDSVEPDTSGQDRSRDGSFDRTWRTDV
jgi:hypothetical protein